MFRRTAALYGRGIEVVTAPGRGFVELVESDREAVSVPITAIYAPAQGGTYVWTVGGDDRVVRRAVTLGEMFGRDEVIVLSGVEAGDTVVAAGVDRLADGEKVRVLER